MSRTDNPFGTCRKCGKRILWVRTEKGKSMPVDPDLINYQAVSGGKERVVTRQGKVVVGARCRPEMADDIGYISHFATCGK